MVKSTLHRIWGLSLFIQFLLTVIICTGCGREYWRAIPIPVHPRAPAHWSIGIMQGRDIFTLQELPTCPNPRISKDSFSDPGSEFVADPFLIREGQRWQIFFELFNKTAKKGEIGLATSADLCTWHYEGVVLSEPFHLSYPFVFKVGGQYYMLPESKQAKEIRLYRAESFPKKWKYERTLVAGEFSDTTPLFWRDRWFLFANRAPYTSAVFSASSLEGDFKEHPQSPLYRDEPGLARPAGRPVLVNGNLFRFVQDNREGYGKRVRAIKITELSPTSIKEEIAGSDPFLQEGEQGRSAEWNSFGMHHISPVQLPDGTWVAAVDGNAR